MRTLFAIVQEGYTPDYKRLYGKPDRTTILKSGDEVRLDDIPSFFEDKKAISAIMFFNRWRIMGFPYGAWGENPSILVEVVELLDPIDRLYNPRSLL